MSKKMIHRKIEKISEEIEALEADRHPKFFKHEAEGRKRLATLLLELNDLEEDEAKIYKLKFTKTNIKWGFQISRQAGKTLWIIKYMNW